MDGISGARNSFEALEPRFACMESLFAFVLACFGASAIRKRAARQCNDRNAQMNFSFSPEQSSRLITDQMLPIDGLDFLDPVALFQNALSYKHLKTCQSIAAVESDLVAFLCPSDLANDSVDGDSNNSVFNVNISFANQAPKLESASSLAEILSISGSMRSNHNAWFRKRR
jgi:hypothetical protein